MGNSFGCRLLEQENAHSLKRVCNLSSRRMRKGWKWRNRGAGGMSLSRCVKAFFKYARAYFPRRVSHCRHGELYSKQNHVKIPSRGGNSFSVIERIIFKICSEFEIYIHTCSDNLMYLTQRKIENSEIVKFKFLTEKKKKEILHIYILLLLTFSTCFSIIMK